MIRRAGPGDETTLSRLAQTAFVETFVEDFSIDYPPQDLQRYLHEALGPAAFGEKIQRADWRLWIAETATGEALGYASAGPASLPHEALQPGDGELKQLYVLRPGQGQGIGAALFAAAEAWLLEVGQRRLWIGVWSGNDKAIAFYERRGFTQAGGYKFAVGDSWDDELIYCRPAVSVTF